MNTLHVSITPTTKPYLEGYDIRALVDDPDGPMKAGQVGSIVDVSVSADGNHQYVVMPRGLDVYDYAVLTHPQVVAHEYPSSFPAKLLESPREPMAKRNLPRELKRKTPPLPDWVALSDLPIGIKN
jgi:hypothetical protein